MSYPPTTWTVFKLDFTLVVHKETEKVRLVRATVSKVSALSSTTRTSEVGGQGTTR